MALVSVETASVWMEQSHTTRLICIQRCRSLSSPLLSVTKTFCVLLVLIQNMMDKISVEVRSDSAALLLIRSNL